MIIWILFEMRWQLLLRWHHFYLLPGTVPTFGSKGDDNQFDLRKRVHNNEVLCNDVSKTAFVMTWSANEF